MEEKKIKDMTGNRQEKIASKKPVKDTPAQAAPRAPKRPFVRVAIPGADMTEHISKKAESAGEEKPMRDKNRKDKPAEAKQGGNREKVSGHGGKNRRHDRKDRRHNEVPAQQAAEPKSESPTEKTAEPKEQNKQSARAEEHGGKRRHERNKNRKEHAPVQKDEAKAPKELAKETVRIDKHRRRKEEADKPAPRKERVVVERATPTAPREDVFTDEQLRADGLLFTLDEEPVFVPADAETPVETEATADTEERFEVVGIRFRGTGKTYFFSPAGIAFREGDHAIVETVRGMEYGDVLQGNRMVSAKEVVQPLKPVLRKATEADSHHHLENRRLEDAAKPVFLEKVAKNKLDMQLVDVEYTFDNTKLCFYFTAEGRVDFRELVKDLASVFRTRIELRQIGVRDEARLFGGLGVCGRPFCCKSFLADFAQVSIKMAKEQNLSLASAKISGSCGRLMCCLRYEQDTYERENAALPKVNSTVDTPKGKGVVLESNFLTKKIKVQTEEDNTIRFFAPEEVTFVAPPPRKSQKEDVEEDADIAALTKE